MASARATAATSPARIFSRAAVAMLIPCEEAAFGGVTSSVSSSSESPFKMASARATAATSPARTFNRAAVAMLNMFKVEV